MSEQPDRREEARLEKLFKDFSPPLADDGFTASVINRVQRRLWRRRLVLSCAAIVGAILAVVPLARFANRLGAVLVEVATNWNEPTWLLENQTMIIGVLLLVALPPAVRLLER